MVKKNYSIKLFLKIIALVLLVTFLLGSLLSINHLIVCKKAFNFRAEKGCLIILIISTISLFITLFFTLKYIFVRVSFTKDGLYFKSFIQKGFLDRNNVQKTTFYHYGCKIHLKSGEFFIIPKEIKNFEEMKKRLVRTLNHDDSLDKKFILGKNETYYLRKK